MPGGTCISFNRGWPQQPMACVVASGTGGWRRLYFKGKLPVGFARTGEDAFTSAPCSQAHPHQSGICVGYPLPP